MAIEYKKVNPLHGIMSVEDLNSYGAQGWDNYAVNNGVFYFKRQISNEINALDSMDEQLVSAKSKSIKGKRK